MKKILLVATVQSHIAQFHKPLIAWLTENGYGLDVAARDNLSEKPNLFLDIKGEKFNVPFSRSPFSFKNLKAYKQLSRIINNGDYDIVHCNTPVGGILTRIAANRRRKKGEIKVIYEAHGFHFFKGGDIKNWVLWYPIEKWFSRYTDTLITINKMDYAVALEKFKAKNVKYIPGVGIDLSRFENADTVNDIKTEFGLSDNAKIVMSVGELNKNKNHQVIIRALHHLKDGNIHYLIAGNGPLKDVLIKLSAQMNVQNNIHFLGYRRDVPALLKGADVYAFPSLREGLGLASIEAMAAGLSILTSDRHGINDYSENGKTGFKYHPLDYKGFADGIRRIVYDDTFKQTVGEYNKTVSKQFTVDASMDALTKIYREILND